MRRVAMNEAANAEAGRALVTRTLWVLCRDGQSITCVVSGEPGHEQLQVLVNGEVYFNETHTVHEGAVGRARALQRGFEAHGWTPVFGMLPRV
jgi:hypothetical protein